MKGIERTSRLSRDRQFSQKSFGRLSSQDLELMQLLRLPLMDIQERLQGKVVKHESE
jgi:hypothetical protein